MHKIIGTILFSVLFSSVMLFAQNDAAQNNVSDAKKYIEQMNNKIESAMVDGDVDAMNDYYADNIVSLPSYEPMVKGKNKIIQKTKKEMESGFKFNSVKFKTVDVFGSGNHVYEIGEYDIVMVYPDMPQPVTDKGKYLTVWEKASDGKWKAVAEMWNTNTNPWTDGNEDKDKKTEKRQ